MDRRIARVVYGTGLVGLALLAIQAVAEERPTPSPSPRALEVLERLESNDPYERQAAFLRLEALREPGTLPAIRRFMDSKDPEARAASLRAVAAIEGAPAIHVLLEKLHRDQQPRVRRAALLALEPLAQGHPEVLDAFLSSLRDRSPEVRMTAIDIVSRIDDARARQAIRLRYKKEHERDVRRVLELAMKRLAHHD